MERFERFQVACRFCCVVASCRLSTASASKTCSNQTSKPMFVRVFCSFVSTDLNGAMGFWRFCFAHCRCRLPNGAGALHTQLHPRGCSWRIWRTRFSAETCLRHRSWVHAEGRFSGGSLWPIISFNVFLGHGSLSELSILHPPILSHLHPRTILSLFRCQPTHRLPTASDRRRPSPRTSRRSSSPSGAAARRRWRRSTRGCSGGWTPGGRTPTRRKCVCSRAFVFVLLFCRQKHLQHRLT